MRSSSSSLWLRPSRGQFLGWNTYVEVNSSLQHCIETVSDFGRYQLANLVEIRCADLHCPVAQVIGVSDLRGVAKESVARKLVGDVLLILAPACRADAVFHQYFGD